MDIVNYFILNPTSYFIIGWFIGFFNLIKVKIELENEEDYGLHFIILFLSFVAWPFVLTFNLANLVVKFILLFNRR